MAHSIHVFTDANGREVDYDDAVKVAREYIVHYGSIHEIVDEYLRNASFDEIALWITDPETGFFADDIPSRPASEPVAPGQETLALGGAE